MSELDKIKESINQMRLWLGAFLVTDISLIGWFVSNLGSRKILLLIAAGLVIIALAGAIVRLNKKIEAAIERLGEL